MAKEVTRKKIAAAIYEYRVDCDGEWVEILFDFERGESQIIWLADWDTTRSHVWTKTAIEMVLESQKTKLPKEEAEVFERP